MGIYTSIVKDLMRTEKGREDLFLLAVGLSEEAQNNEKEAALSIKQEIYLRNAIDEAAAQAGIGTDDYLTGLRKLLRSKEEIQCQMQ